MKRFLIHVILGVMLMAIGTTTLVLEIKDFTIVDGRQIYTDEIKTYTVSVKEQNLNIRFLSPYETTYEWITDDSLKDEVKLELFQGTEYTFDKAKNQLELRNTYVNTQYQKNEFQYLTHMINGLKEKKLYIFGSNVSLVITSSHKVVDKIKFQYN